MTNLKKQLHFFEKVQLLLCLTSHGLCSECKVLG